MGLQQHQIGFHCTSSPGNVIFLECRSQGETPSSCLCMKYFIQSQHQEKQWGSYCSDITFAQVMGLLVLLEFITLLYVQNLRNHFFHSLLKHFWGFTTRTKKARRPRWGNKGHKDGFCFRIFQSKRTLMDAYKRGGNPEPVILTAAAAYQEINPYEFKEEFEGELGGNW